MSMTLDQLKEHNAFRIKKILSSDVELRKRLVEMGIHKGTKGVIVRRAPLGDPIQIWILGYDVSLRKSEAMHIQVEQLDGGEDE
jgi:ferrous iron transport protein B